MTDPTIQQAIVRINEHLGVVADVIRALTSDEMFHREAFRAAVRSGYRCLTEAEIALAQNIEHMSPHGGLYLQARIQLAATNLGTAVAAYRAAWAST